MKTRYIRMVAGIFVLALISGCASDSGSDPGAIPDATPTDSEASSTAPNTEEATSPEGVELDELVEAAKAEGSLMVYSSVGEEVLQTLLSQFEEAYGISTSYVRKTSSGLIEQFETERQAGMASVDVLMHTAVPHMTGMAGEGELLSVVDLPNAEEWPDEFVLEDSIVNFSISPWSILWNTDLVSPEQAPSTWEDVLNLDDDLPILMIDPTVADSYLLHFAVLLEEYGEDFLKQFIAKADALATSGTPASQSVAAGEYAVGLVLPWDTRAALAAEGAPIDGVVPDFTGGAERLIVGLADAPHPNAAKLFLNFMMSPEAQETMNGEPFNTISPLDGIPGTTPVPARYVPTDMERLERYGDQVVGILQESDVR